MTLMRDPLISMSSNCWRCARCRRVRSRWADLQFCLLLAWLLIYLLVYLPRGMVG
jgi:hypothetical protein